MRKLTILIAVFAVLVAGCGSQRNDFKKQIEQQGMKVASVREDKETTTSKSTKRAKKSTTKVKYEAEVLFGKCRVELEQGKGEKRYYLDEVNGSEPAVGLMKDSPNRADIEGYLRSAESPCRI